METPEAWGEPRTRTIEWFDPLATAEAGLKLSGREYLQGMLDGRLPFPPIAATLGFVASELGEGTVTFRATPDESVYNPVGLVHGGFVCTLLDSVTGCAVHSTLPAGVGYTSIEIKVNYLRPIHATTGEVIARGWVTKPGRRIAFAEGSIEDGDGKLLATASSSLMILA